MFTLSVIVHLALSFSPWAAGEAREKSPCPHRERLVPHQDVEMSEEIRLKLYFRRPSVARVFDANTSIPLWHVAPVHIAPDTRGRIVVKPQGRAGEWRLEGWRVTLIDRHPPFQDDHVHFQFRFRTFRKRPHGR
jgi:hypothetical protein